MNRDSTDPRIQSADSNMTKKRKKRKAIPWWYFYCDLLRVTQRYREDFTCAMEHLASLATTSQLELEECDWRALERNVTSDGLVAVWPKYRISYLNLIEAIKHTEINGRAIYIPKEFLADFASTWNLDSFFDPDDTSPAICCPFDIHPIVMHSCDSRTSLKEMLELIVGPLAINVRIDLRFPDSLLKLAFAHFLKQARGMRFPGSVTSKGAFLLSVPRKRLAREEFDKSLCVRIWAAAQKGKTNAQITEELWQEDEEITESKVSNYRKHARSTLAHIYSGLAEDLDPALKTREATPRLDDLTERRPPISEEDQLQLDALKNALGIKD